MTTSFTPSPGGFQPGGDTRQCPEPGVDSVPDWPVRDDAGRSRRRTLSLALLGVALATVAAVVALVTLRTVASPTTAAVPNAPAVAPEPSPAPAVADETRASPAQAAGAAVAADAVVATWTTVACGPVDSLAVPAGPSAEDVAAGRFVLREANDPGQASGTSNYTYTGDGQSFFLNSCWNGQLVLTEWDTLDAAGAETTTVVKDSAQVWWRIDGLGNAQSNGYVGQGAIDHINAIVQLGGIVTSPGLAGVTNLGRVTFPDGRLSVHLRVSPEAWAASPGLEAVLYRPPWLTDAVLAAATALDVWVDPVTGLPFRVAYRLACDEVTDDGRYCHVVTGRSEELAESNYDTAPGHVDAEGFESSAETFTWFPLTAATTAWFTPAIPAGYTQVDEQTGLNS
ncbi:MAG: hypothetical protein LBR33_11335 [Propionibacteriaceae bacterium]|jgi:hypothetical protein|nr:hypothetical protein [Propionibacteriaceae bacterium]